LDRGVDSPRVDTVKHMPIWFWQEFTGDMYKHKPDIFICINSEITQRNVEEKFSG
jgi:glycosidase